MRAPRSEAPDTTNEQPRSQRIWLGIYPLQSPARGRLRCEPPGRRLRRLLEPGCSAAPARHCLALLPSGPDAVRRLPVRGTWPSTLRAKALTPNDSAPQAVFGPAIADCGFREPLAPRLARPGTTIVAEPTKEEAGVSTGPHPISPEGVAVTPPSRKRSLGIWIQRTNGA